MNKVDGLGRMATKVQKGDPKEEKEEVIGCEGGMGPREGWSEYHSPEAPRCRRQRGVSSRRLSGLCRAL